MLAELADEPRRGVQQAVLEEPEPVADLVDDARPLVPHLVGLPEQRDLLAEPGRDRIVLRRRLVELREQPRDPDVRDEDRPARRLGGMSRQHELDVDVAQARPPFVFRDVPKPRERVGERLARRDALLGVLAASPQPVMLLGDVRELEVERERAQDELLALDGQRRDRLMHLARRVAFPRPPREQANLLDRLEELGALLLDEHLAEDRPEQTDVSPQRRGELFGGGVGSLEIHHFIM